MNYKFWLVIPKSFSINFFSVFYIKLQTCVTFESFVRVKYSCEVERENSKLLWNDLFWMDLSVSSSVFLHVYFPLWMFSASFLLISLLCVSSTDMDKYWSNLYHFLSGNSKWIRIFVLVPTPLVVLFQVIRNIGGYLPLVICTGTWHKFQQIFLRT